MNITVLAVGTKMPQWVDYAVTDYSKRFGREIQFQLKEIKPEKRGPGTSTAQAMAAEEARIVAAIPAHSYLIVLDERGKAPTSMELADWLKKWQHQGDNLCFVIGGADGMTDGLKQRANFHQYEEHINHLEEYFLYGLLEHYRHYLIRLACYHLLS